MHDAGRGEQRGYSLVELVLVIVLLGVVAFVVTPRLFSRSSYELTSFYDRLGAGLDYARAVAVATNCPVEVKTTSTHFSLEQPSGTPSGTTLCPSGGYTADVPNPATGKPFGGSVPSGATLSVSPGGNFCFGSLGQVLADCGQPDGATAAADKTVTLQGKSGATLSITVYASTGYAERG